MTCGIPLSFDNIENPVFAGRDPRAVHVLYCRLDGPTDGANEITHRIEIRRPRSVFSALHRTPSERLELETKP